VNLRQIASLTLSAIVLSACADAPTTGGGGSASPGVPHGNAPSDLVLRWGYEGGFTPPEFQLTNLPSFSLYGDGTIVRQGAQIAIYPGPALPAIETVRIDEAAVQAVIEAALDANLDTVGDLTDMGSVAIADAPDTVFTVRFGDVDRTVRVYALTDLGVKPPAMPDEEQEARKRLLDLIQALSSLETWLPKGSISEATVYEPSGARIFVSKLRGQPDPPQSPVEWPLDTPLSDIGEDAGAGFRCVVVTGAEWTEQLRPAAGMANQLTPWVSEGRRYTVAFRPLLPDETAC